jgi:hypothetical protein
MKEGKTRKQGQKLWEDRNRRKCVPHEVEIYKDGGGGLREADRMRAMFRTGK